jgi:hypothetical protein
MWPVLHPEQEAIQRTAVSIFVILLLCSSREQSFVDVGFEEDRKTSAGSRGEISKSKGFLFLSVSAVAM